MKNIKKYLVILLFFLVLWIAYFTFINWKCRIIIKDIAGEFYIEEERLVDYFDGEEISWAG